MMGGTHMLGGAAVWLAGCAAVGAPAQVVVIGAGVAVAGALAPDVDHARAEAAQWCRAGGLAAVIAGVVGLAGGQPRGALWAELIAGGLALGLLPWAVRPHGGGFRGVVHSAWGLAVVIAGAVIAVIAGLPWWGPAAFVAGWVSHLALDALTREGLRFGWPSQRRWAWFPKDISMRTGGRKPGARGSGKIGREYLYVRPVLALLCAVAGWLAMTGGHA